MAIKKLTLGMMLSVACLVSANVALAQETDVAVVKPSTLEIIRERGTLICGASNNLSGFAARDENNRWYGFDVDFCRALAAAIFGDSSRVEFRALQGNARYVELQSGEIDVLARSATWTLGRDLVEKVHYIGTSFFDSQSFLVHDDNEVVSVLDLGEHSICVEENSTAQLYLHDYFFDNQIEYVEKVFEDEMDLPAAYNVGVCTAISASLTRLQNFRLMQDDPKAHKILPEIIAKSQYGPVVRSDDDPWANIVRWALFSMINAEELGVTSSNVGTMAESRTPAIRRLIGIEGDLATNLGLDSVWVRNMIEQVGNYGELFERNLGSDTPINMRRGLNALWSQGGLIYAPPIR